MRPARSTPAGAAAPEAAGSILAGVPGLILVMVLVLVLALPFTATAIPPLLDYPNHLARMAVEAPGGRDPALGAMYRLHWAFYPDLAMDLVVPALARLLPLYLAGSLFIVAAMLLTVFGTVALHRAWFAGRSPWPYASALTAYNAVLASGFLNYLFAVGLALCAAAMWIRMRNRTPGKRAVLALGSGLACLVCHAFGFAIFALLVVMLELDGWHRTPPGRRLPAAATGGALLAAGLLVPLALYKLLGPANTYNSPAQLGLFLHQLLAGGFLAEPRMRVLWLMGAVSSPGQPIDALGAAALVGVPAAAVVGGSLGLARPILWAAAALLGAYLVLPSYVVDCAFVYPRLAPPLVLLAIAGLNPRLARRPAALAVSVVAALVLFRAGATYQVWLGERQVLREVRTAMAPIRPCDRVLAVREGQQVWMADPDEPRVARHFYNGLAYANLPALIVAERHAFWPMLFTESGKQPLGVRGRYARLQQADGYLPLARQLTMSPGQSGEIPGGDWPAQLRDWRGRYDEVLVLHARHRLDVAGLRLVRADGFAALYQVEHQVGGGDRQGGAPAGHPGGCQAPERDRGAT